MLGTACFFNWFLVKKRTKRVISGRFSGKTHYNRTTIFSKRNGFILVQGIFLTGFSSKIEQNVRFVADFQGKPFMIER